MSLQFLLHVFAQSSAPFLINYNLNGCYDNSHCYGCLFTFLYTSFSWMCAFLYLDKQLSM
uniref:Uncharacterized protein n=1 Tax=Anguilla anguilla TaxID=7936 RepID=A0A0E9WQP9_ANGAN